MIAGIGRRAWSVLVVPLALAVGGFAAPPPSPPPPPSPAYSPPAAELSPFSSPDRFCDPAKNHFDSVASTDPRLGGDPISVVVLDPADGTGDTSRVVATYAQLIAKCGGIGGRPVDVHVVPERGDPTADCLAATRQFRAFIVVALAPSAAVPCIVRDQRTIVISKSAANNVDLAAAGGRLAATGSSEGVLRARVEGLVGSGALDGRAVTIVSGTDSGSAEFLDLATTALRARKVRIVGPDRADTMLAMTLDPSTVAAPHRTGRSRSPYEIYDFSDRPSQTLDQLRAAVGTDATRVLRDTSVSSFTSVDDPSYRGGRSPSAFSEMCQTEFRAATTKTASPSSSSPSSTTTTTQPVDAPPTLELQHVADVCLAMRVVARTLFAAGIDLTPRSAIRAMHRLPYIDTTAPSGTPKPRPNQVVNEPVRRIEQVVVLTQAEAPCTGESVPSTTTEATMCWTPAPGWDEGGRVVNVPLVAPTR